MRVLLFVNFGIWCGLGCQPIPEYEPGRVQFPNAVLYRPSGEKVLRFGVVPQQGPSDIEINWAPLAKQTEWRALSLETLLIWLLGLRI